MPLITTASAASARGLGFCKQTGPRTQPISGYELWLDSSDAATFTYSSGSVISRWIDKSPSAYFFEPSSTTYAPSRTGTQNSKSTVVFDGTDDFLISTAATSAWKFLHDGTQSTVIVVYKNTRVATGYGNTKVPILDTTGYDFASIAAGYQGYTFESDEWYYPALGQYYSSNSNDINSGIINSGQSYPARLSDSPYLNSSFRNTWNVSINLHAPNDTSDSTRLVAYNSKATYPEYPSTGINTYGWTGPNTASPAATLKIGAIMTSSSYPTFKGEIAEIIMYKRKLSVSEKSEMMTYLQNKWSI